ncbi:hypothetical protein SAMN02745148_01178 [Modicisalibacter ilicicola DSM 19980]|uniref:Uncharacterized protein n=1 Tax=Modicisalibacter ilicicola DSM 19980 TaxID=1121942 RepID=A0A1M4WEE8_9GAMM|nr:hypothetical protein SAMN02745148_01178 [Halomonas ilicicola DSM 19980]
MPRGKVPVPAAAMTTDEARDLPTAFFNAAITLLEKRTNASY